MILTLLISIIIGIALAGYLGLVSHQNRSIARSLAWNSTMPVLESGVEEALTQIHFNGITNLSANGWSVIAGGLYYKKRALGDGSYYEVTITPTDPPVINSVGYEPTPLAPTTAFGVILGATPFAGQSSHDLIKRRVQVKTMRSALFTKAMLAKGQINLNGNNISTDSFDSQTNAYSTNGKWDINKRKSNGDVATISGLMNSLNIGNADIRGHVSTGPNGTMTIGPNGAVGDNAWVAGHDGIQTGWAANDLNVQINDVTLPSVSWTSMLPGNILVGGLTYNFVFGGSSFYKVQNLSGKVYVAPGANVVIYVPPDGTVNFTGQGQIVLGDGAKVKLYVGASSATLGGNGVINPGSALNFIYYGLPSNTSLSFNGNAAFTGAIYAPQAAFSLGGGGNNAIDFSGASVTASVTMNGHFNFHFDEALSRLGPDDGYVVTAWNEVPPN
jgi:hypothetical protein